MSACMVSAGELRHVAQLKAPRFVDDGHGGSTNEFIQKGQMFCKVIQGSGSEPFQRQRSENRKTVTFITRYRNDIRTNDQIVFECWSHNILDIDDFDRLHRWIKIKTERGQSPIDKIDIVNELYFLTFDGEEMIDFSNEVITENYNESVSNNSELNLQTFAGETVVTVSDNNCGV